MFKYSEEFMIGLDRVLDKTTHSGGYQYLGALNYSFEDLEHWLSREQEQNTYLEVRSAVYSALVLPLDKIPLHINGWGINSPVLKYRLERRITCAVLKYRLEHNI